ncbi:MAG: amidase family protein, partial [Pseudomonadota bacterium]
GDGGGSIRIPAAHCGVFGLKTSRHRLPRSRIQLPGDIQSEFCVTRSVRDSARLLAAIERRDGPLAPVGLVDRPLERPLRIVVSTRDGHDRDAEPEVRAAVAAAAALCESLGHHVAEGRPDLEHRALYEAFLDLWASVPESLIFGWRRLAIRLATGRLLTPLDQMFEPWTLGLAAWSRRRRAGRADPVAAALARFELEAAKYDAFFATQADVWITPVLREPPPPLGHLAPDAPFETLMARILAHAGHTPLHNALGAPAMSVPLHWTAEGLPIGVQFAARAGADGLLLGLALALEAAAPWAERAPPALFPAAQAPLPSP